MYSLIGRRCRAVGKAVRTRSVHRSMVYITQLEQAMLAPTFCPSARSSCMTAFFFATSRLKRMPVIIHVCAIEVGRAKTAVFFCCFCYPIFVVFFIFAFLVFPCRLGRRLLRVRCVVVVVVIVVVSYSACRLEGRYSGGGLLLGGALSCWLVVQYSVLGVFYFLCSPDLSWFGKHLVGAGVKSCFSAC